MEERNKPFDKIDKQHIFKVPPDYFEELPGRIQARIQHTPASEPVGFGVWSLRYALPAFLVLIMAGILIWQINSNNMKADPEQMLALVSQDEIIAYLELSDISAEEIIDFSEVSTAELISDDEINVLSELNLMEDVPEKYYAETDKLFE